MLISKTIFATAVIISTSVPGWAATHYVAPKGTTISAKADGSETKPWGSVSSALKAAKGGDTLLLMDGLHNPIKLYNVPFDAPVTIRSMNGKGARVEWILLDGKTRNLVFRDLSVWPSNINALERRKLIETNSGVSDVTFDSLDIRSSLDAPNYPSWSTAEWKKHSVDAVFARGPRTQIINNKITGVEFGIQALGNNSIIAKNSVSGFAGDGLRALGNSSTVRDNKVTDCVQVNKNHADGFQSWSRKTTGPVDRLIIDGNTIIEWSNAKVSPLRCKLQGIGLFDGFFDNLVIQNNTVSVSASAYHGISVYGARHAMIVNNTVVSASGNPATTPWLGVYAHRNKTPSTDVIVANNLAMSFRGISNPTNRVVAVANTVITYPATAFSDVTNFNYIPKAASGFIDTGDMLYAPKTDIMGTPRPQAKGPDRGAFEVSSATTAKTRTTTGAKFTPAP